MSEFEPPADREKPGNSKPFVIRGHHLRSYFGLIERGFSPSHLAEINAITAEMSEWRISPHLNLTYKDDVLGLLPKKEAIEKFKEKQKKLYDLFLRLSNAYPAEIVEGKTDKICEGCAIGKHCQQLHSNISQNNFDGIRIDGLYLDKFIENINRLHLPKPIINYEMAHFLDDQPQKIRLIKTTIGIVRKVLGNGFVVQ
ncbi:MAG: hypothetical protein HY425_00250 [Candidatus Levybacteria bacterium]|nr:hypothetical protein [Candidatus Levybacteria bacterium]